MYRPPGWEVGKPNHMTISENEAYEAGADAILGALREDNIAHAANGEGCIMPETHITGGSLVFIPDA